MDVEQFPNQDFEEKPVGKKTKEPLSEIRLTNYLNKFEKKLFIPFLVIFVLVLLFLFFFLKNQKYAPQITIPSPAPTPSPTPIIEQVTSPSAYATDSAILKIEEDLKNINNDLQSVDLKETSLYPPLLDWEVKF